MKKLLLLFLTLFVFHSAFGQETKEFDFVIIVNNDANPSLTNLRLQIENIAGEISVIDFGYHPGSFSISLDDYERIISDNTKSIILKFGYDIISKNGKKIDNHQYEIDMEKSWFSYWPYTIMHIQNVKLRKRDIVDDQGVERKNYILFIYQGHMTTVRLPYTKE